MLIIHAKNHEERLDSYAIHGAVNALMLAFSVLAAVMFESAQGSAEPSLGVSIYFSLTSFSCLCLHIYNKYM
jgi:hypothetical protein